MKKIGRGWQYTVYDTENNRVLKRYNTRIQAYSIMLKENFPYTDYPLWKFDKYYKKFRNAAIESIGEIEKTKIDLSLFGNPKILNKLDYEQDKVIPLNSYFKNISTSEGKITIDKFIEFNQMLIKNRLIDKTFLIGKNYGINFKGEIILIDLGELSSNEEIIDKRIKGQPWDDPYVTATLPNEELRDYFIKNMNLRLKNIEA